VPKIHTSYGTLVAMEQKIILGAVALLIVAAVGIFAFAPQATQTGNVPSGKYTALATCIKDSGATFFGAFWCPHCKEQKELFGDAVSALPYVECSTPDGQGQLQACKDKDVKSYPTWEFKDGTRMTGTIQLNVLAAKTSCTLPE